MENMEEAKNIAGDQVEEAKSTAGDKIEEAKSTAGDKLEEAKSTAGDKIEEAKNTAGDKLEEAKNMAGDKLEEAKDKISETVKDVKEKLPDITPTAAGFKAQSSVQDLKSRLEWGEPAFTIVDVRDHAAFHDGRIMGAITMPTDDLVERAKSSLETNRDIYVYGETDEETATAASHLRQAGFQRVAELKGGLAAWKAVGGPTEGVSESRTPTGADDYNVASRLKND